jgi:glycosyltransferase involved in cell wall biosynthesis
LQQTTGIPARRIEVIHNAIRIAGKGASTEKAAALRAELMIAPDSNVIVIVGRLSREKDHLTLLEAVKRLPPTLKPHLLIVGDGPERPHIEARIRALQLESSVTLTGQQVSSDPYYGIARVAVLSSRSEGSPNALLEAMAARIPVVATAVGGIPEIVSHGESALLVHPGEFESMAGSIQRLLQDDGLAESLSTRAFALIRERHTPEGRARKLFEIYRDVCRVVPTSSPAG